MFSISTTCLIDGELDIMYYSPTKQLWVKEEIALISIGTGDTIYWLLTLNYIQKL